jgi:hypothetical protein
MNQQQTLALDTVHFLNQQTTDSNPFGDRDEVRSVQTQQRFQQRNPVTALRAEALRQEAQAILDQQPVHDYQHTTTMPANVSSDCQLLTSVKREMLAGNPANLINVLIFYVNVQVSRGMPNHNQATLNILQDMKNLFVARHAPQPNIVAQLNSVLCALVQNLNNEDYDSTESIVDFVEIVGCYYLREFLIERQVILQDPEAFDLLSAWLSFQFILKRQMPMGATVGGSDVNKELLDCMKMLEERVSVPVV